MIKVLKRITIFILLVNISLIFTPNNVFAYETDLISVNDPISSFTENYVEFYEIQFQRFENETDLYYGLIGKIHNTTNLDIVYNSTITYYDANKEIIGYSFKSEQVASGEFVGYIHRETTNNLYMNKFPNDIYYYQMNVNVSFGNEISSDISNSYYDYTIEGYDILINVNENNILDITEKISTYFNVSKHGIYRKIPLKNKIVRLDGTTSYNRPKISNINVSDNYTLSNQSGYKVIKIGDADFTLTGEKDYTISYTYNLGKDTGKEYDELYFNLIGDEWDTTISNITFTINMPKEFDSSKLGFSSGKYGSVDSSLVSYEVNGNVITGRLNKTLYPEEAFTVRLELPEGYFVGTDNRDESIFIPIIIPIVFLIVAFLIWRIYGKDDQVVETVEFYPPNGLNSLDLGFIYAGRAENRDVVSLLIYLANKGYIKISEHEEQSLLTTIRGFKITKLKEYDGNDANEALFLKGLFKKRPAIQTIFDKTTPVAEEVNEITSSDLRNNFYTTMNAILRNVNRKENIRQIFEKKASSKQILYTLMTIISYCLITIPPMYNYGDMEGILFALIFPGVGFSIMFSCIISARKTINSRMNNSPVANIILGIIFGLIFSSMPLFAFLIPALIVDPIYLFGYLIGLACIFGIKWCSHYLPKRTPYGNEMLGRIVGFKNFLETAEKDRLEAMVTDNPTYFYDILPYTYVLGISDKWISKFESIAMQSPSWYDGSSSFNMVAFSNFMNTTMSTAQSSMSSSSSSSGSSGGGSSGGGSGGGGGGSW